ncbi:MAG: SMC-Scp complex subunit ScpB [Pseudomonadota bacterium]
MSQATAQLFDLGSEREVEHQRNVRIVEAILFASAEPVKPEDFRARLPADADLGRILSELSNHYADRGVQVCELAGGWALRTAPDLSDALKTERVVSKKPTRALVETLAIIGYHQPVTRAEIENIRGVSISKGTLDQLVESGWVKPGRRRESPGRPLTWVTTDRFLDEFGLASLDDLPGVEELRSAGFLDKRAAIDTLEGLRLKDGESEDDPEEVEDEYEADPEGFEAESEPD